MIIKRRFIKTLIAASVAIMFVVPFTGCGAKKTVNTGSTWEVTETTRLTGLTIADGASIKAPEGYSITMTVDGVETGINPGTYEGDIMITKTKANVVEYTKGNLTHYFRQAIYMDDTGIVADKSVLPAAGSYSLNNGLLTGVDIQSEGEAFNGIYVSGGTYTIKDPIIDFTGNGGNDFAGYGAAIMSTGEETTLVVDGAKINTHGAVRTAVVAGGGSNLIIKNSDILTKNGVLPADYVPNVSLGHMKNVPWMLGLVGNCRATNLLGDNTKSTYINSSIAAEGWGVLSTDDCQNVRLTAINSKIAITGYSGYGAYSIGDAIDACYGCDINVGDYSVIITGGNAVFAASTPENVTKLNEELNLGLSEDELNSIKQTRTTVTSGRFGVMWHGKGYVKVFDDTVFNTEKAIFLVKGASADINVDGSKGAQLNPKNGIIIQMMDDDNPGIVMVDDMALCQGVYHEPTGTPPKAQGFDVAAVSSSDVIAAFSNIALKGDFYNSFTGYLTNNFGVADESGGYSDGTTGSFASYSGKGKNMSLTFKDASITGIISSSTAKHDVDTITSTEYIQLGQVNDTPSPAVNNGVIVTLDGSAWTVTGTSYLTSLTIGDGSVINAPEGSSLNMTVDGIKKAIKPGTYKGNIVITVAKS